MKFKTGFFGFLIGAFAGAAFGLLYAPKSGEETRENLAENSQKVKENALEAIQEAQDAAMAKMNETQIRIDALRKETKGVLGRPQLIGQRIIENQKSDPEKDFEETREVSAA